MEFIMMVIGAIAIIALAVAAHKTKETIITKYVLSDKDIEYLEDKVRERFIKDIASEMYDFKITMYRQLTQEERLIKKLQDMARNAALEVIKDNLKNAHRESVASAKSIAEKTSQEALSKIENEKFLDELVVRLKNKQL